MIHEAAASGVLHASWTVVVCIFLVLLEFLAVALVIAPRAVLRKLLSWVRARAGIAGRTVTARPSAP